MLASRHALKGAVVLDLFAGSGALGIEALSRGAGHATFVESHRATAKTIAANLEATGLSGNATLVVGDAHDYVRAQAEQHFDLVLADPPYAFADWDGLLEALDAGLLVAESDRQIGPSGRWQVLAVKRYGSTVVTLMSPTSSTSQTVPAEKRQ